MSEISIRRYNPSVRRRSRLPRSPLARIAELEQVCDDLNDALHRLEEKPRYDHFSMIMEQGSKVADRVEDWQERLTTVEEFIEDYFDVS